MDNNIDRKIDDTAILFLLVQNRQQTHDWTLILDQALIKSAYKCEYKIHHGILLYPSKRFCELQQ